MYAEYRKLTEAAKKGKMHPNSGNDLMAAAIRLFPQIADVAKKLRQAAGESRMSGSGACLFASFGGDESGAEGACGFWGGFSRYNSRRIVTSSIGEYECKKI